MDSEFDKKEQKEILKRLKLPRKYIQELEEENNNLDNFIGICSKEDPNIKEYEGTHPVTDKKECHEHDNMKRLMLRKEGDLYKKCGKKFDKSKDPFNLFGYGVKAYFKTIMSLIRLFGFLSIMFIPTLYIYA